MSIMDKMMDRMINKMTPEEKEGMMPLMMKDVDMSDVMAKMMPEMMKN